MSESICMESVGRFSDESGGYNMCQSTELFKNPKEVYDGAVPSGNSVMAYVFVRLYQLTENDIYRQYAEKQIDFMSAQAHDYPAGYCMFLLAKLLYDAPSLSITVAVKDDTEKLKLELPFLANVSVVQANEKYSLLNGLPTYYVCKGNMCLPPTNELTENMEEK